ncbi:hypothetical protein PG994_004072 [Apiospora phragmitis]|uniref:Uncharacterized protein n=1 Tax=Apiospora phragmitis TaxID=2905665 RepID=A0ABR1VTL5_9PEZI
MPVHGMLQPQDTGFQPRKFQVASCKAVSLDVPPELNSKYTNPKLAPYTPPVAIPFEIVLEHP